MTIIFDGKAYSSKKEKDLKKKVLALKKKEITPKLATLMSSEDLASKLYVSLKTKAANRVGIEVESFEINTSHTVDKMIRLIKVLNMDNGIHGIMVQLPLGRLHKKDTKKILRMIAPAKDIDGLREDTTFVPATVSGILQIIELAKKKLRMKDNNKIRVAVVGSLGMVGKPLVKCLIAEGYKVNGLDKSHEARLRKNLIEADIVVSATGRPEIIHADMIKKGAIVVDVGSPKGDVLFNEVSKKAGFITPVPGGVGPVTIVSLLDNLMTAIYNQVLVTHT